MYSNLDEIPRNTGIFVVLLGVFGAFINYHRRTDLDFIDRLGLFLTDLISSVTISIATFAIIMSTQQNELLAIGVAGYVAHQGTRIFYIIERVIAKKFGIKL